MRVELKCGAGILAEAKTISLSKSLWCLYGAHESIGKQVKKVVEQLRSRAGGASSSLVEWKEARLTP